MTNFAMSAELILGGIVILGILFILFRKLNTSFENDMKNIFEKLLQAAIAAHDRDLQSHPVLRYQLASQDKKFDEIKDMFDKLEKKLDGLPCSHIHCQAGSHHEPTD